MNTYVIGDLQGCADELARLLDSARFDPASDRLWLVGDLINRGPKSVETLRLVRSLGEACVAVLGNHDLSVLAQLCNPEKREHLKQTARSIDAAADAEELVRWLRHRPMAHAENGYLLIHAGLPPQWTVDEALNHARTVEAALRGDKHHKYFASMYGDKPKSWDDRLHGHDRLRFITNCLTRLRYCDNRGRLALDDKHSPNKARAGLTPWFAVPGRRSADTTILFGHWSTLGQIYWPAHRVWGLDTGCVWGGALTALHLESQRLIQLHARGYKKPGAP